MTATLTDPLALADAPLTRGRLGVAGQWAIAAVAVAVGLAVTLPFDGFKWGWALVVAAVTYIAVTYTVARVVEDRRQAADRVATAVMTTAFVIVLVPLASVTWTVIKNGAARFDLAFFTDDVKFTTAELAAQREGAKVGGASHAILGTLIVTGLATVFAVPFGLFTAIYLVEYGVKSRLARAITAMVDVMTGIPSIVAGLFAYALFELFFGPGTRSGLSAAVALTVLMTPVVVRSAEEMLRLVPNELREASYALGVPKWKTIVKVVIPTAIAGILTGITLAIARVIGETAPLLITAGVLDARNLNPFSGRMTTLPVYAYQYYQIPGTAKQAAYDRVWAAALTLVLIVGILFTLARVLATVLKPKGLK
ncbi:MAG TPA: phosphate ABC transporter permease PstA [Ilumatobacter sp.]|nr:phosphate ABC transporter permease PstA [Ilumatobacter sp.]